MRHVPVSPPRPKIDARRPLMRGAVALLWAIVLASPSHVHGEEVALHLLGDAAGTTPVAELAIGNSLFVSATGLEAHQAVEMILLDEAGAPIRSEVGESDEQGRLHPVLLWARTGVRGCDAGTYSGYPHETFADAAAALTGTSISVVLWHNDSGTVLASATLSVVAQGEARVFVADAASCPIQVAPASQPLFLVADDTMASAIRVFVVPRQSHWVPGMQLEDARVEHPHGQRVQPQDGGWVTVLAAAGSLPSGHYDVIVRPSTDPTLRLNPDDMLLVMPPRVTLGSDTTDDGMQIDPWAGGGGGIDF